MFYEEKNYSSDTKDDNKFLDNKHHETVDKDKEFHSEDKLAMGEDNHVDLANTGVLESP